MQTSIIIVIIAAAITATRSARGARWPLWAAGSIAVMPFVVLPLMRLNGSAATAALYALEASTVAWPVAWALVLGWFFRAARKPFGTIRTKPRRP